MPRPKHTPAAAILITLLLGLAPLSAEEEPAIRIPKVTRAPKLADFLENRPREAEAVVSDFRQFDPGDGSPVTESTVAYLSYDDHNLYVVFVCKDDPALIRSRLAKRKDIMADDRVTVNIDTFHDHKRAYFFDVNAHGVQMDGITTDGQGDDFSFETVWYTESKITADGYVVLETIPFRSLRFPDAENQRWGVALARFIQRNNEMACWPHVSRKRLPQFVGQFGHMDGLEGISPGRNVQFIPYTLLSGSRFLDRQAGPAGFRSDGELRPGLDTKLVLRDAFTLDATVNPDFSQIESDEPQVTINQRYEVFFPERRPFFTENSQLFETPENLFFSRRIVDPQFGVRLTGKVGRWAIAALTADDRAAGELSAAGASGRAGIGVLRIQREFGRQSHIGALVTDREFGADWNRVGSFDARLRFSGNWVVSGQAVSSRTARPGATAFSGQSYRVALARTTRHVQYQSTYLDRSPGFRSDLGFIPRVDVRELRHRLDYRWRPEGRQVVAWGPSLTTLVNWNRAGQVQDWEVTPSLRFELPRLTYLIAERSESFELFRGAGFRKRESRVFASTEWLKSLALTATYTRGLGINYYPAAGAQPFLAGADAASVRITVRPTSRLRLDESYLYSRLASRETVFNDHIVRSKVNFQFTRALSARGILDYSGVLPNAALVSLERSKRINGDVLVTYLLHPGTALYAGYTSSYENFAFDPLERPGILRSDRPGLQTGRQFFVKLSYLFRY